MQSFANRVILITGAGSGIGRQMALSLAAEGARAAALDLKPDGLASLATELHGNGAHLDNLETHDERLLLPNTCFSVEPGIYFPGQFGIRSEVNMITRPGIAAVTGPRQTELLRI